MQLARIGQRERRRIIGNRLYPDIPEVEHPGIFHQKPQIADGMVLPPPAGAQDRRGYGYPSHPDALPAHIAWPSSDRCHPARPHGQSAPPASSATPSAACPYLPPPPPASSPVHTSASRTADTSPPTRRNTRPHRHYPANTADTPSSGTPRRRGLLLGGRPSLFKPMPPSAYKREGPIYGRDRVAGV